MIRFEKSPFTKKVKLILKKRPSFFSKEIGIGFLAALSFHLFMTTVFTIDGGTYSEPRSNFKGVVETVASETQLKLLGEDLPDFTIAPPPRLPIPILPQKKLEAEDFIALGPRLKGLKETQAYIRGEYPKTFRGLQLVSRYKEDALKISFRSDPEGRIFWLSWIQKPLDLKAIPQFEAWIKTLTFPREAAFIPQTMELFFSYD